MQLLTATQRPSAHADIASLQHIVKFVQPKHLVPIHTDSPNRFAELFPDSSIISSNDNEVMNI